MRNALRVKVIDGNSDLLEDATRFLLGEASESHDPIEQLATSDAVCKNNNNKSGSHALHGIASLV